MNKHEFQPYRFRKANGIEVTSDWCTYTVVPMEKAMPEDLCFTKEDNPIHVLDSQQEVTQPTGKEAQ